ncbi:unnamed protein product [Somion occarium]|uniref:Uncharacterized protein n=1 Tax=Somion occarium TaxID=3059160 RepID=A0ABP1DZC9_9APHY
MTPRPNHLLPQSRSHHQIERTNLNGGRRISAASAEVEGRLTAHLARDFSFSFLADRPRSLSSLLDLREKPPIIDVKDRRENDPELEPPELPREPSPFPLGCPDVVRSSALRIIREACWSSTSLVSTD